MTDDDQRRVWTVANYRDSTTRVYHTDRDCNRLSRASTVRHVRLSRLREDTTPCETCEGDEPNDPSKDHRAECPYCGAVVARLPSHLPCAGVGGDGDD